MTGISHFKRCDLDFRRRAVNQSPGKPGNPAGWGARRLEKCFDRGRTLSPRPLAPPPRANEISPVRPGGAFILQV